MKSITWYAYFKIGNDIHILGIEIEKSKINRKTRGKIRNWCNRSYTKENSPT